MPLFRHSVGTDPETSSHATCQGTFSHSRLSSQKKKKKKKKRSWGMIARTFSPNPRKRGGKKKPTTTNMFWPEWNHTAVIPEKHSPPDLLRSKFDVQDSNSPNQVRPHGNYSPHAKWTLQDLTRSKCSRTKIWPVREKVKSLTLLEELNEKLKSLADSVALGLIKPYVKHFYYVT